MYRNSIVRGLRTAPSNALLLRRTIVSSAARMGEGDAGAPRSGGAASSDAFTKREAANEDFFVKQKEKEKLQALKDKIAEHQKHLAELDQHVTSQMKPDGDKK